MNSPLGLSISKPDQKIGVGDGVAWMNHRYVTNFFVGRDERGWFVLDVFLL